jgi:phage gpG-like protein
VLEHHWMMVGSDVDYGAYHQHGGGNLPRRRPVEFPEAERKEWVRVIHRMIRTGKPT